MPSTATDRLNGLTTSVAVKAPVRAVTSANITLSGLQTVGGVALAEGDRVLVKDQSSPADNGIYIASTSDWTRAKDFDGNLDAVKGTLVVTDGVSTALLFYRLTTSDPVIIGTSAITFVQASEVQNPYPRTQAEIDAGVTPTDYAYEELNILRYGADPFGVSSSDAAIQNGIKVARAKRDLTGSIAVEVFWPCGLYTGAAGVPLVTGVAHRCASRWSATYQCTGSGAAAYTATYSAGIFTDNLSALQAAIQAGTSSVENAALVNLAFDHTGTVSGNAPSGHAWEAVVQINGAPHVILDSIYAASVTNNIHGISVSLSWRSRISRTWTPRQGGHTGGTGLLVDSESNSTLIEAPFSFGAWGFAVDLGANSITLIEPNIEQATIGLRLSGNAPRVYGGYYEGNGTDIRLGLVGSPVNRAQVIRPWCNGAASTYSIDILAAVDSLIVDPFFTGTYSTSKFKTTAAPTENYGNIIEIHAADANGVNLTTLGLIGGRNFVRVLGEDNDDHRFFKEYKSSDGLQVEQQLNQRGASFVFFELKLINNAGTLQVVIGDGDEATTAYTSCFVSASATPATLPDVSSGAGFGTVGAGRLSGTNSIIVLNTNANVLGEQAFMAGNVRTNGSAAIACEVRISSRNINGVTQARPEIRLRNATSDAAFDFDTANFTNGEYVKVPIMGFIR